VRSVNRHLGARLGLLALCLLLVAGAASGCSTTQEKAEKQQARATHILNARAERQKQKKKDKKQGKADHKQSQNGGEG
jgi:Flp pilus assembly protein TadB